MSSVDAVLFVSFGGPNDSDEVMPFLRNVTRGRNVPDARLADVAEHYYAVGGRSPINEQNLALVAALREEFETHGIELPVYWGNRNWEPYVHDALTRMRDDGRHNAVAFVTSAFSSYSGCRQYREDIERARELVEGAPQVTKIRQFFNHPGFIGPMIDNVRSAVGEMSSTPRLVFTAHSIPMSMATNSRYVSQLSEASRLVAEGVGADLEWDLVFQSRSGPPSVPWLEPDVNDHLRKLEVDGVDAVVVVPIGFISDHMEVVHDLDDEARRTAREVGIEYRRASTVGTDARFVSMIRELVEERTGGTGPSALGAMGPVTCQGERCCLAPLAGIS